MVGQHHLALVPKGQLRPKKVKVVPWKVSPHQGSWSKWTTVILTNGNIAAVPNRVKEDQYGSSLAKLTQNGKNISSTFTLGLVHSDTNRATLVTRQVSV